MAGALVTCVFRVPAIGVLVQGLMLFRVYGFRVLQLVGVPQVLRFRDQVPGWDTSSLVASWSISRLGYSSFEMS